MPCRAAYPVGMAPFLRDEVEVWQVPDLGGTGPGGCEDEFGVGGEADGTEGSIVAELRTEVGEGLCCISMDRCFGQRIRGMKQV